MSQVRQLATIKSRVRTHPQFASWGMPIPDYAGTDRARFFELLFEAYRDANGQRGEYWVNHSPANIRHVPSLSRQFAGSKFLHILRDGRAIAASIRRLPWSRWSMRSLGLLWAERVSMGLAAERYVGPEGVMRVRYEELLRETEPTLERICEFLGFEYEPAMALGGGFHVSNRGGHRLVGLPPQKDRISAWRKQLNAREIELFEFYVGELLECLGYAPDFGLEASPPTRRERVQMSISDSKKSATDRLKSYASRLRIPLDLGTRCDSLQEESARPRTPNDGQHRCR
jgi:hypothetical protein